MEVSGAIDWARRMSTVKGQHTAIANSDGFIALRLVAPLAALARVRRRRTARVFLAERQVG